jgi:hypothetical protein
MSYHERERSLWKGALAGVAGGLAGAWAMNQFQRGLSKLSQPDASARQGPSDGEDATMKAADAIVERVANRQLTKEQKQTAGPIVHYLFGATMGAAYGAVAEMAPRTAAGWGAPFATALWVGADEVAVPAFGLSKSPFEYPPSTHASAFAAHLVYGATAEAVRRGVRAALRTDGS